MFEATVSDAQTSEPVGDRGASLYSVAAAR